MTPTPLSIAPHVRPITPTPPVSTRIESPPDFVAVQPVRRDPFESAEQLIGTVVVPILSLCYRLYVRHVIRSRR